MSQASKNLKRQKLETDAMCEHLGVHKAVLNALRNIIDPNDAIKKSRCLEAFLNVSNACWEQVVKVAAKSIL